MLHMSLMLVIKLLVNGKSNLDINKLKLLSALYNVSLDELLLYLGDKKEINIKKMVGHVLGKQLH